MFGLLTAALGAIVGKAVGWEWDHWMAPFTFEVDVSYKQADGKYVRAKNVEVYPQGIVGVGPQQTNQYGQAIFQSVDPHPFRTTTIQVTSSGYSYLNPAQAPVVPLIRRADAIQVLLKPDNPPPSAKNEEKPQSPTIANAAKPDIPEVDRSGPQPSGEGGAFGPTTVLCSKAPPADGYTIKSESFELVGDRRCNAWSECRQTEKSPTRVCYSFRMQGHSEWTGPFNLGRNNGSATSEGVLSVLWAEQPK